MGLDAIGFTLGLLCIGVTFVAVRSSYWILRAASALFWAVFGIYWRDNVSASITEGSAADTAVLIIIWGMFGVMFAMIFWASGENGRFSRSIRRLIRGEEQPPSVSPREARRTRNAIYRDKIDRAMRGER